MAERAASAPILAMPLDGAAVADALQFEWRAVEPTASYRLQIAASASFVDPIANISMIFQPRRVVRDLEMGNAYFWRVAAVDDDGVEEWSGARRFSVESHALPPGRTSLQLPANNAVNQPIGTVVEWAPTEGAIGYQLQVSLESRLQLLVVDLENIQETRFAIRALVKTYPYWWRVRAAGPAGYGPWSSTWKFVVVN